MWRNRTTAPPEKRPTDAALLEALRLNHDHVRGVTRLDQELVYVPLTALGAAVFAAATRSTPAPVEAWAVGPLLGALFVVMVIVGLGLWRNHGRHRELLGYRTCLVAKLGLPRFPERTNGDLAGGRLIYASLFLIGWAAGSFALVALLTRA